MVKCDINEELGFNYAMNSSNAIDFEPILCK